LRLFELLLRLYPKPFRERFEAELRDTFEHAAAESDAPRALYLDLFAGGVRERLGEFSVQRVGPIILALPLATLTGYLDMRAREVQGIVLILLILTGVFALAWPRRAWLWALLFGVSVPAWHFGVALAGLMQRASGWDLLPDATLTHVYIVKPNLAATFLALIPAVIGSLFGAGIRMAIAFEIDRV